VVEIVMNVDNQLLHFLYYAYQFHNLFEEYIQLIVPYDINIEQ
jgi:hypothetical protein